MVDQVRFPPYIGGSGKTYTNDANPQTGMFNGGHRVNFFPILADTVAAAGYVAQYAQAIDGAKANADRAEDARGYVEAVADQYKVNILDQFKRKATVSLDFISDEYISKNSITTNVARNPGDLMIGGRSSPYYVNGPDGNLHEVGIDVIARHWKGAVNLGMLIASNKTTVSRHSEDFTASGWSGTAYVTASTKSSPVAGKTMQAVDLPATQVIQNVFNVQAGETYFCRGFIARKDHAIVRCGVGGSMLLEIDFNNQSFELVNSDNARDVELFYIGNGIYEWRGFFTASTTASRGLRPAASPIGSPSSAYAWGVQAFLADGFCPYVTVADTPITLSRDQHRFPLGQDFNADFGCFYYEFSDAYEGGLIYVGENGGDNRILVGHSYANITVNGIPESVTNLPEVLGRNKTLLRFNRITGETTIFRNGYKWMTFTGSPDFRSAAVNMTAGSVRFAGYPTTACSVSYMGYAPELLTDAECEELTL